MAIRTILAGATVVVLLTGC
jgi:surface antigen